MPLPPFVAGLLPRILALIRFSGPEGKEISLQGWLYGNLFQPLLPLYLASLTWAILYVLLFLGLVWWMYRRKIIIKV